MKSFNYDDIPKALLMPDIVAILTSIHEHKGKQGLYIEAHSDVLTSLMEVAKIQSTGASNRIEGIYTTDKRLEERVEHLSDKGLSKSNRVKAVIDRKVGAISKHEILETCPDISKITVERALNSLVKKGYIVKIGMGRTTTYGKTDRNYTNL